MATYSTSDLTGGRGRITLHIWRDGAPRYIALVAHAYGIAFVDRMLAQAP